MLIINGGQTGVDRAVLDFCIRYNINYTGYVSDAEDLTANQLVIKYPNLINENDSNIQRTKKNIELADWLICISDPRTQENNIIQDSRDFANQWVLFNIYSNKIINDALNWYKSLPNKDIKVCIGGARESWNPGIYQETFSKLEIIYQYLKNST